MAKLLIVDDEIHIRDLICKYANHDEYDVITASNGEEAIKLEASEKPDLIVMDIMMPVLDGFSAVKEIRKTSKVPVIMLSARSEEYDKIYGFDIGVDDYVTKPFSAKELMLRIKAVLNRYNAPQEKEEIFIFEGLTVNKSAHRVTVDGTDVDLTKKEFDLLVELTNAVDEAVTRDYLLDKIWGQELKEDRTLDTHIKSLRKKIGKYSTNIVTLRRVGYRFETK